MKKILLSLLVITVVTFISFAAENSEDLNTLLINAVAAGNIEGAKAALEKGADANIADKKGKPAFRTAIESDSIEMAELFLKHGADINKKWIHAEFPVLWANSLEMTKYLVEHGANVRRTDHSARSVLERAYKKINNPQRYETVKYLIEQGADTVDKQEMYRRVLRLAVENKEIDFIKLFVESGINISDSGYYGYELLSNVARNPRYDEITKYLLENGAEIDAKNMNNEGCTQLIAVSFYVTGSWDYALGRYMFLVKNGADVNARDKYERTALMGAAQRLSLEEVRYLVECGADVNAVDMNGKTVLMYACGGAGINPEEKIRYLIERGADISAQDNENKTPVMYAIESRLYNAVRLFVERGINIRHLYYLKNPKKCSCGNCNNKNRAYQNKRENFIEYLIRNETVIVEDNAPAADMSLCLCSNEVIYDGILPLKEGMNVRKIENFCSFGDAGEENGY